MKIETNVPMPKATRSTKYPFRDMNVGESVFFDNEPNGSQSNPAISAHVLAKRDGLKFSARKENNGVRIWRIL